MNGSYNANHFLVRLRGLPWNTTPSEVENFLQGCRIRDTQFVKNEQGRFTGECYVILETKEDIATAKSFDKKMMGNRYIEVFEANSDSVSETAKSNNNDTKPNDFSDIDNWREPVVRLRGLPYNSSKSDIIKFFTGLDIAQNGVFISASKPAGEAFVAFTNMDNALRALDFNRMNMGHRYIEVFKATYAEARASIVNDSQTAPRQKSNDGPQRSGQYTNSGGSMSADSSYNNNNNNNNSNNTNQYNRGPPPSNNYEPYSNNGNNYSTSETGSGSLKRSIPVSFTMKMRGVPFQAGKAELFDFFSPVVPIRLEQENTPRGKPPIWFVEFGSREEATKGMTFHKKFMGTRFIELLPLYDEINRSKMSRS